MQYLNKLIKCEKYGMLIWGYLRDWIVDRELYESSSEYSDLVPETLRVLEYCEFEYWDWEYWDSLIDRFVSDKFVSLLYYFTKFVTRANSGWKPLASLVAPLLMGIICKISSL